MTLSKRCGKQDVELADHGPDNSPMSAKTAGEKPPRPAQCRNFAREAVAESMPEIVMSFVSEAKRGSVPHLNLLTKLGGFDHRPAAPPSKRRGKSFARRLLDQMQQHEANAIAASKKSAAIERAASK